MEEFFIRYRNVTLLLVVVALQFILLGYQVRSDDEVRLVRVWAVGVITPLDKGMDGVADFFASAWKRYFWLIEASDENREMRQELTRLRLENQSLRRSLAQFEREERLIGYQAQLASETLLAHVIGVGPNRNAKEIFLDEGASQGLRPGMAVITAEGIAGKIQAVYPRSSLVQLIHDRDSGVGVILGNSRIHGVLKGRGTNECRVDYVGHEVDVEIGEPVYTSGDDRIFPKGFPVGEVVRLEEGTDFREIFVRPYAALDRLDEVLVVTSGVHQQLPAQPEAQTPVLLMSPPGPELPAVIRGGQEPGSESAGETAPLPSSPVPGTVTDADLIRERYRDVARIQEHTFGEGTPTSPPPDFNLGQPFSAGTEDSAADEAAADAAPAPASEGAPAPPPQQP